MFSDSERKPLSKRFDSYPSPDYNRSSTANRKINFQQSSSNYDDSNQSFNQQIVRPQIFSNDNDESFNNRMNSFQNESQRLPNGYSNVRSTNTGSRNSNYSPYQMQSKYN